jgi:hypothetical protein
MRGHFSSRVKETRFHYRMKKTRTEGENQKDRRGDFLMDKLIEGGGMQKTNIHKVMKVYSSFKIKRRIH